MDCPYFGDADITVVTLLTFLSNTLTLKHNSDTEPRDSKPKAQGHLYKIPSLVEEALV